MYKISTFRFIPKHFETNDMKKIRLQEEMSGLKHHFSIEGDRNSPMETKLPQDDDNEIDPVDEGMCRQHHVMCAN